MASRDEEPQKLVILDDDCIEDSGSDDDADSPELIRPSAAASEVMTQHLRDLVLIVCIAASRLPNGPEYLADRSLRVALEKFAEICVQTSTIEGFPRARFLELAEKWVQLQRSLKRHAGVDGGGSRKRACKTGAGARGLRR